MFPLQRLGFEVWALDTVCYSSHPGHPTWRGRARAPEEVAELIEGLDALGALKRCDAVLTGYLGLAAMGDVVLDALSRVRAANPRALYLCDPVMGDSDGGLFVAPDIPGVIGGRLLPEADIVTPNAFELEALSGAAAATLEGALGACDRLRGRTAGRPGAIVVTGLERRDGPAGTIEILAADGTGAWVAATPKVPLKAHGTGDAFAALLLGHYLRHRRLDTAVARAASALRAVIRETPAGADELALIAAQRHFDPEPPFVAMRRVRP